MLCGPFKLDGNRHHPDVWKQLGRGDGQKRGWSADIRVASCCLWSLLAAAACVPAGAAARRERIDPETCMIQRVAVGGRTSPAAAPSGAGCGAECPGACFAGICLFTGSDLSELPRQKPSPTPGPSQPPPVARHGRERQASLLQVPPLWSALPDVADMPTASAYAINLAQASPQASAAEAPPLLPWSVTGLPSFTDFPKAVAAVTDFVDLPAASDPAVGFAPLSPFASTVEEPSLVSRPSPTLPSLFDVPMASVPGFTVAEVLPQPPSLVLTSTAFTEGNWGYAASASPAPAVSLLDAHSTDRGGQDAPLAGLGVAFGQSLPPVHAATTPGTSVQLDKHRLASGSPLGRLKATEALATRLGAENTKLRHQLGNWHRAGEQVVAREARMVQLLEEYQVLASAPVAAASSKHQGQLLGLSGDGDHAEVGAGTSHAEEIKKHSPEQKHSDAEGSGLDRSHDKASERHHEAKHHDVKPKQTKAEDSEPKQAYAEGSGQNVSAALQKSARSMHLAMIGLAVALSAALLGCFGFRYRKAGFQTRCIFTFGSLLRRMRFAGPDSGFVEIAEIQLGNLLESSVHEGLRVEVTPCNGGKPVRTRMGVPSGDGDEEMTLSFADIIVFPVHPGDGPCVFSIFDCDAFGEDEKIATVELCAQEVLSMANDRREYFSWQLSNESRLWHGWMDPNAQPYLAVRLRKASEETSPLGIPRLQRRGTGLPLLIYLMSSPAFRGFRSSPTLGLGDLM